MPPGPPSATDPFRARMLRRLRRFLLTLLVLGFVLLLAGGGAAFWLLGSPLPLRSDPTEFHIAPGSSLRTAARDMVQAGVGVQPWALELAARVLRVENAIKAGSYEIRAGVTALDLLAKLTRGDVTQADVVIIEGWTLRQMRERLNAHPDLAHDSAGLSDAELLRRIGVEGSHGEGLFFPDTYLFSKRASDLAVLGRAHRALMRHLEREWAERAPGLPYRTPYEALIMASIVEKETGRDADRGRIAAVFVNRLRAGMLLQTDPSVIYGLGEHFDGNLRKRDLTTDTPYNTYTRPGLPPTPIALPGLASLRAALHPEASDALYFVARGDGSSHFSRTLEEHNRAVARYQKGKR